MAEGLGVLLFAYIGQLLVGTAVIGTVALRRLRSPTPLESRRQAGTAWTAIAMFALSIIADAWFLFDPNKALDVCHQAAVFGLSFQCVAFALSLMVRGPGRIAIPVMSVLFALPWLPFVLT